MFKNLPDIEFVSTDTAGVESSVIATYEAITGKKLHPGDPVRLFLEALAYIVAQQRNIIDHAARQNLLAFAEGEHLDHLGILTDTERLPAQPAKVTLEFFLAEERGEKTLIPEGTRATPGEQIRFSTVKSAEIEAGDMSVQVEAKCTSAGEIGNGYAEGQIDKLVDRPPHVDSVTNVDKSSGGSDQESDESLRDRIRQAPSKYSTAGPDDAYIYWAKDAHPEIMDVSVKSPSPGEVEVYVLMEDGEIPGQEILDAVQDKLDKDKRRPLTDNVSVHEPEQVQYDIQITYYISKKDSSIASTIQDEVEKAVQEFRAWQRSTLGRDIVPSELIRMVQNAGAKRVDLSYPQYQTLDMHQVASADNVQVTYGGLEDE